MENYKLFTSTRIVLENTFFNGGILVNKEGKIQQIMRQDELSGIRSKNNIEVIDVGELVLMPGIIDSHVHVNEPGRTDWEGFETATKAAAAGGITTIVDMPLNSNPPTTTVEHLQQKIDAATGKTHVDVAFWGGLVPGNQDNLLPLIEKGVVGFKGFMCCSGIDEFQCVTMDDIEKAYETINNLDIVLAFHAEIEEEAIIEEGLPSHYNTFLNTRPSSMEVNAVTNMVSLCQKYNVPTHIVHVSSAECLPIIRKAKEEGINLTAETCHHYLYFNAEDIPNGATQFKCTPPIRELSNQHLLWQGLKDGILDMVVSDHSPCTPDLKCIETGNFLEAWGGISSVQFGLSIFWTRAKTYHFSIFDINKYLTQATSKLTGLSVNKGVLAVNYDADFVIWDPNEFFVVQESDIHHKNKITPYLGQRLYGKVYMTIVRGEIAYEDGKEFGPAIGKLLVK